MIVSLAALSLVAGASPAAASVTIGQLAPASPPASCIGGSGTDRAQPTVTSGNAYVVPGAGTITSWSHNAAMGAGQELTMKIFRKVGEPATYLVVGHDGPGDLAASVLNTFPASIPVKPGDVLGLHVPGSPATACKWATPGESYLTRDGDLADGAMGPFDSDIDARLNVSAVFVPSNDFSLGTITRNRRRGTATITATVPNRGTLVVSGRGVRAVGAAVTSKLVAAPGKVKLRIGAKGRKRRTLLRTGRVRLRVRITYTPAGGDPRVQSRKVRLRKRL